jgi:Ran GTPase-activating protein (RanGAP) involved in mRNA processing and transport
VADDNADEEDEGERSGLTRLDLSWNSLGLEGAAGLGIALATNESLRTLRLSHCAIKPNGAICVAEGMRTNCHLTALDLSWNPIGDAGLAALMAALQAP